MIRVAVNFLLGQSNAKSAFTFDLNFVPSELPEILLSTIANVGPETTESVHPCEAQFTSTQL